MQTQFPRFRHWPTGEEVVGIPKVPNTGSGAAVGDCVTMAVIEDPKKALPSKIDLS